MPSSQIKHQQSDALVQRLSTRYLLVMTAVAGLIAVDQAVIQPLLVRMDRYAPAINIAGRQRMLSQRIVKTALILERADDGVSRRVSQRELEQSFHEWARAHRTLRVGDALRDVRAVRCDEIDAAWLQLEPHFKAMSAAAQSLAHAKANESAVDVAGVNSLITHEAPFLAGMERIVALMEEQASLELAIVRLCSFAIAVSVLLLIAAVGRGVVRPALQAIRGQIGSLEYRVLIRTAELENALSTLRRETDERQKMELRSHALAAKLAHADRVESVGHLAVGLAHELNQPLGAIASYTQAAQVTLDQPLDASATLTLSRFMEQIEHASMRAGGIVRRIRNFVRPGFNNSSPVDLTPLIHEVVELYLPELKRREVRLSLELPNKPLIVLADAIYLQQVLVNLIQNGVQALASMPPERRWLTVRAHLVNDAVQLDVLDGGPGLASHDPEFLFAPFNTTKADGLGIGLAICRSIIEQHQGTIWARSHPDGGAQFSFVLPLTKVHACPLALQSDPVCG